MNTLATDQVETTTPSEENTETTEPNDKILSQRDVIADLMKNGIPKEEINENEDTTDKTTETKPEDKTTETTDTTDKTTETKPEDKTTETPITFDPPQHWPDDKKELFKKADPGMQKYLLDSYNSMLGDYTKKTQAVAPYVHFHKQVDGYLRQIGEDPIDYMSKMTMIEYRLRTGDNAQKLAVLAEVAEMYGITPPGENDKIDPNVTKLQNELGDVKGELAKRDQNARATQQQQWEANRQEKLKEIQEFRYEKDEAGKLKRPFFDEVWEDMLHLDTAMRQQGKALSLQELHDRAVWANPTVRQKMNEASTASNTAKTEEERKKVEAAKKAGSSITNSGGTATTKKEMTQREVIASLYKGETLQ